MPTVEEIIQALSDLDPATFENVINTAYRNRPGFIGEMAGRTGANPKAEPDEFARWLADRHLSSDAAIDRVVYLPTGAPTDEIRLLEVNRLLTPPDSDVIEPLDFTPDTDPPFKVFVADVTSDQWEQIQREPDKVLPVGWRLEDNQIFSRG